MSEKLVLNPGSVSHQSAQLAPNHIHQSQWLAADPEHQTAELELTQTADPELTQTAELDKVVADNPLERLSKLNLGQWTLSSFTGLKVITNPDQTQSSEFQFSKQDQGLQSQLELVAEVLETAYQQEQATDDYQDDSPSLRFEERAWSRALDCCLENAKQAKQDGNSQTVNDSLMSGLILSYVNPSHSSHRPFRHQVVSSGLAAELLTTVKDNKDLVLEEDEFAFVEESARITTLVSTLKTDKDMLELVVGQQLEMDQFNLKLAQQLSQAEVEEHIQSMDQQALNTASLSPEIGQRDPELQKQVIKATVGYLADANNHIIEAAPIAELAKLRPDIFEDELQPELRKIRTNRRVGDKYRINLHSVFPLDATVLETWAAGNQDLASQMLTACEAEVTSDGQADPDAPCSRRGALGWRVQYSQLKHDPDRAQTVLDEISQHINQRRTVMFDKVDHYINNFAEDNQLDQEVVEQSLSSLNRLLDKSRIDDSTDPEYYVQLLTDLAPKLVNKADLRPLELLMKLDGTRVMQVAEMLLQDDRLTVDNMVELLSQSWLPGSDIINSWPPEAVTSNARDLFQAFELVKGLLVDPSLADHIKNTIFKTPDQNYLEVAKKLTHTLSQPRELWKNLYLVSTDLMGIDPGNDQANTHPISVLPKIELDMSSLPPNYHFIDAVKGFKPVNVSDLSADNLRAILVDSEDISDQQLQQFQTSVPFNRLTADAKRQVYAYQLYETVQRTRSDSYKAAADERNRQHQADQSSLLAAGDFIHSTSIQALGGILQVGNLAGESRQLASQRDAFPFNVDLSVVKQVEPTPQQTIGQTFSAAYGDMSLIYDHNQSDWLRGKVVAVDRQTEGRLHSLALGGIPATEISAIVLEQPTELQIDQASRLIAENGFYIAVYSGDGQLKLTPEAYDNLRASYNIDRAKIGTVVDNYLDTKNQQGSNLGSEYYLPADHGMDRYYIKFGGQGGQGNQDVNGVNHVWTEFLGDQLYRDYGLAVPDTKMVQIDGRVGKASKWLDANQPPTAELTGFADGFVMDAWTGNWDAAYNDANVVAINGASYRIDNGNALDLRAQGDRKQAQRWSQTVTELETGSGRHELANGMRHMYPGLTAQAFSAQVDRLADKFPDDKIDQLVDSIRRSAADRDSLKQTLKARRDYIISNQDRIASELSRPALQAVDRTPAEEIGVPTVIESLAA